MAPTVDIFQRRVLPISVLAIIIGIVTVGNIVLYSGGYVSLLDDTDLTAQAAKVQLVRLFYMNFPLTSYFAQEEDLVRASSELDKKIESLIKRNSGTKAIDAEGEDIKRSLQDLIQQAHTTPEDLLKKYREDHETWKVAPEEDKFGQEISSGPVRYGGHTMDLPAWKLAPNEALESIGKATDGKTAVKKASSATQGDSRTAQGDVARPLQGVRYMRRYGGHNSNQPTWAYHPTDESWKAAPPTSIPFSTFAEGARRSVKATAVRRQLAARGHHAAAGTVRHAARASAAKNTLGSADILTPLAKVERTIRATQNSLHAAEAAVAAILRAGHAGAGKAGTAKGIESEAEAIASLETAEGNEDALSRTQSYLEHLAGSARPALPSVKSSVASRAVPAATKGHSTSVLGDMGLLSPTDDEILARERKPPSSPAAEMSSAAAPSAAYGAGASPEKVDLGRVEAEVLRSLQPALKDMAQQVASQIANAASAPRAPATPVLSQPADAPAVPAVADATGLADGAKLAHSAEFSADVYSPVAASPRAAAARAASHTRAAASRPADIGTASEDDVKGAMTASGTAAAAAASASAAEEAAVRAALVAQERVRHIESRLDAAKRAAAASRQQHAAASTNAAGTRRMARDGATKTRRAEVAAAVEAMEEEVSRARAAYEAMGPAQRRKASAALVSMVRAAETAIAAQRGGSDAADVRSEVAAVPKSQRRRASTKSGLAALGVNTGEDKEAWDDVRHHASAVDSFLG